MASHEHRAAGGGTAIFVAVCLFFVILLAVGGCFLLGAMFFMAIPAQTHSETVRHEIRFRTETREWLETMADDAPAAIKTDARSGGSSASRIEATVPKPPRQTPQPDRSGKDRSAKNPAETNPAKTGGSDAPAIVDLESRPDWVQKRYTSRNGHRYQRISGPITKTPEEARRIMRNLIEAELLRQARLRIRDVPYSKVVSRFVSRPTIRWSEADMSPLLLEPIYVETIRSARYGTRYQAHAALQVEPPGAIDKAVAPAVETAYDLGMGLAAGTVYLVVLGVWAAGWGIQGWLCARTGRASQAGGKPAPNFAADVQSPS